MTKPITMISLLLSVFLLSSPGADAAELKRGYFIGKWEINGGSTCGAKDVEYVVFRDNGTFENGRAGRIEMVGFWSLEEDLVYLHTVTSPAFFQYIHPQLEAYEDRFGYYPMKAMVVNQDENQFTAVVLLENEMTRVSALRCK